MFNPTFGDPLILMKLDECMSGGDLGSKNRVGRNFCKKLDVMFREMEFIHKG